MEVTGKPWRECFPAAHHSVRNTPNRKMGLSSFEVLFGCAPRLGPYFPPTLEMMAGNQVEHATQLSQALKKVGKSVSDSFFRCRQRPQDA
ncbi:hypothetical protein GDO81_024015 [Engystomops pustulosus]|uniref:Uncharacterized protein n=1 Tax=Engystomops pustulosus TaxID=76066 RepID=A0AAV6YM42_ENGPU|nr:hypothetical protein GDO81_024015 [Engystomops pustulosus]